MFAYLRNHRRTSSTSNNTTPGPNYPPSSAQQNRLCSPTNGSHEQNADATALPARSPGPRSPMAPRLPSSSRLNANWSSAKEAERDDESSVAPVSLLPPVLPPIPSIVDATGQKGDTVGELMATDRERPTALDPTTASKLLHVNPLKLNALPKFDEADLGALSQNQPLPSFSGTTAPQEASEQPAKSLLLTPEQSEHGPRPRPISLAYKLDFDQNFTIDDDSPLGQANSASSRSPNAPPPISPTRETPPPTRSPLVERNLEIPQDFTSKTLTPQVASHELFHSSVSSTTLSDPALSPSISRPLFGLTTPTPITTKLSRPRRSLLNPVSLLIRRRTSHNLDISTDSSQLARNLGIATSLPDDYDPRIKGKGVHDFSAPRPQRNFSTNDLEGVGSYGNAAPVDEYWRRKSLPWAHQEEEPTGDRLGLNQERAPEKEHTPVFLEHFDDLGSYDGSGENREALANRSFLARNLNELDLTAPTTPESTPPKLQRETSGDANPELSIGRRMSSEDDEGLHLRAKLKFPSRTQSPISPSRNDSQHQRLCLREHRSSNASRSSRFSFQTADDASAAQEHALEERHKLKAAEKAASSNAMVEDTIDDSDEDEDNDDDDYADDGMSQFGGEQDVGGFEEAIPGVNMDAEDDFGVASGQAHRTTTSTTSEAAQLRVLESGFGQQRGDEQGLLSQAINKSNESDDMYFDDGFIAEPTSHGEGKFDESMFDIMERPPVMPRELPGDSKVNNANNVRVAAPGAGETHPDVAIAAAPLGIDAYHSALASAATKAEAAGKFERGQPEDTVILKNQTDDEVTTEQTYPIESSREGQSLQDQFFHNDDAVTTKQWPPYFEDEQYPNGAIDEDYGDDDLDDDPMIAAANADALAADDSGIYGREFNFYANSKAGADEYNGGHFGNPTEGLGRTTSLREPTLTPITERSEFSRAPSYMSLSPFNYANMNNSVVPPLPSPGLKELAARIGMDHDEMTLKQLLRLKRDTFSGSSATGSLGTSPTSLSSPLFMRGPMTLPRRMSATASANANEVLPIEKLPSNPYDRDAYADESYWQQSEVSSPSPTSPVLTFGRKVSNVGAASSSRNSYFDDSLEASAKSKSKITHIPTLIPSSPPRQSSLSFSTSPPASPDLPLPSQQIMQKFAGRPPASSAHFSQRQSQASQHQHSRSVSGASLAREVQPSDSVAYVREDEKWFLEKRRTLVTGEVVVLGRELVEGGRI